MHPGPVCTALCHLQCHHRRGSSARHPRVPLCQDPGCLHITVFLAISWLGQANPLQALGGQVKVEGGGQAAGFRGRYSSTCEPECKKASSEGATSTSQNPQPVFPQCLVVRVTGHTGDTRRRGGLLLEMGAVAKRGGWAGLGHPAFIPKAYETRNPESSAHPILVSWGWCYHCGS